MSQVRLLQGKVAAITGGLTGIGRAIAMGYMEHGAKVAINYLGGEKHEALLEDLRTEVLKSEADFLALAGDISFPETGLKLVEVAVQKWGRLDIFVSNAGVCQFSDFLTQVSPPHALGACSLLIKTQGSLRSSFLPPCELILMVLFTPHRLPHGKWHHNLLKVAPL